MSPLFLLSLYACTPESTEPAETTTLEGPVDEDGDGYSVEVDCDDADPAIHPGMQESCNGVDDDCDGTLDEEPQDGVVYNIDADGDGFGSAAYTVAACDGPPQGYVDNADDCDDLEAGVFPGAPETCNGLDDNCDGAVDEGIEGSAYFQDSDGDGYGDPGVSESFCAPVEGWVVSDQDCDDGDPAVSPDAVEVCGDGIDNDCDGTGNGCGLAGVASADDARTVLLGAAAGDLFGAPVKNVGDLNANRLDELAVSARGSDLGGEDAGAIYLFQWPISGGTYDAGSADGVLVGEAPGDQVFSVVGLGDSNGDGKGDLLIGARGNDDRAEDAGKVYFWSGPVAGEVSLADADATWTGVGAGDQTGLVMTGDLNGDGHQDALIGAQKNDNGGTDAGAVFVVHGPFGAWLGDQGLYSANAFIKGVAGSQAGGGLASVGDLSGDGIEDLLIGAPYENSGGQQRVGAVYQLNGPVTGTARVTDMADARFHGSAGDEAGWGIASAGDVDGDGVVDFMVNAQRADSEGGGGNEGAVYVITQDWSSQEDVSLDETWMRINGAAAEDRLAAVSGGGDFNGDGHPDLVVGSRWHDSSGEDAGASWVLYGPFTGGTFSVEELPHTRIEGAAAGDGFGAPGGSIGDLNGDGADELVIGGRWSDEAGEDAGAAYLFLGESL
ncbi:MAG: MopE-related protein [Myxococcota bacterium]|nr:MopE-related protein [Myxococcota bacterium]